jgi:hypothetical protein
VAINVYKLVLLLLKFICKQVQHAVERFEDGGPIDYTQFPELPSPEVLHSLQVENPFHSSLGFLSLCLIKLAVQSHCWVCFSLVCFCCLRVCPQ